MKRFLIFVGLLFLVSCSAVEERSYYRVDCIGQRCYEKFIYDRYDPDKRCRVHIYQGREGARSFVQCW